MVVIAKNNSGSTQILSDLGGFPITDGTFAELASFFSVHQLSHSNSLITKIGDGSLTINNGTMDLDKATALRYVSLFLDNTVVLSASTSSIGSVSISDGPSVDAFSRLRISGITTSPCRN